MRDQQQPIAGEKVRQDGILALAADDLVHGVAGGFDSLQRANLPDYRGLVDANVNLSTVQHAADFIKAQPGEGPHHGSNRDQSQYDSTEDSENPGQCTGFSGWLQMYVCNGH